MENGYPSVADIAAALADNGIELVTFNNPNYYDEHKRFVWGLFNAIKYAMVLGVYCPSATTFNVRGGIYQFAGTVKTYAAAGSVDPVDNDTTYIWMDDGNAIGSAIDSVGWPATEHIKLAEIDVDAAGVITDVRDRRGDTFMIHQVTGLQCANIGSQGGVPFILTTTIAAGANANIHDANAPFKYRVIDAWSVATGANGGSWKLTDGTNDITDAAAVTAVDKTIDRASTIDDAYHEIAAGGSLTVVGDGANADVIVYVKCIRVS
jgi:hypothetical protein